MDVKISRKSGIMAMNLRSWCKRSRKYCLDVCGVIFDFMYKKI